MSSTSIDFQGNNVNEGSGKNEATKVVIQQKPQQSLRENFKLATWNVKTKNRKGKLNNVKHEMTRMKIDILGVSEVRWIQTGSFKTDICILYSGHDKKHEKDVGMLLSKEMLRAVIGYWASSSKSMQSYTISC